MSSGAEVEIVDAPSQRSQEGIMLFTFDEMWTARAQDVLNSQGVGAIMVDEDELEVRDEEDAQDAIGILKRYQIPFEVAED